MIKIAVAGIGGVGGYFGGFLARHYESSKAVEVYFIARGENLEAIQERGLHVETTKGSFTARPKLATADPTKIGVVDYLICCTKSYDLEQSLAQLRPCIGPQTVILPLLNGVDTLERIKALYPETEVWDGCVFVVSRLTAPGLVQESGNISRLFFGAPQGSAQKLALAEQLFREAGIEATWSADIEQTIWEKYLFISAVATLTSALDTSLGPLLENPEHKSLLLSLLHELKAVAEAKGVALSDDVLLRTLAKMEALPYHSSTSMHSDFQKGKTTEVESMTGYVVRLGKQLQQPTPTYDKLYDLLLRKSAGNA